MSTPTPVPFTTKVWTWIKAEWHNLGTFLSVAYMALKAAGKL